MVLQTRDGKMNKGVDALSRCYLLLNPLHATVVRFEVLKENYVDNEDFREIFEQCRIHPMDEYYVMDGFLVKGNRLYVPKHSLRQHLILEHYERTCGAL